MTSPRTAKWERASAVGGALVWALLAGLAGAGKAPLGVIELLFLFAPLVVVPLGLALGRMVSPLEYQSMETLALWWQPVAAGLVIGSFCLTPGWVAALFAVPWLLLCGVIALTAALTLLRQKNKSLVTWAVNVGKIDLAVGCSWLVASRLGLRPLGIQEPIILLTTVHFHYTGFATALLATALLAHAGRNGARLRFLKTTIVLVIFTPFVVAMGFVCSATLKMVAAVVLSASVAALAGLQFWLSRNLTTRTARTYIRLSASCVFAGMALAITYAIGDWLKQDWLLIPRMASTHGVLNGLGFSLLGLLGWLMQLSDHTAS